MLKISCKLYPNTTNDSDILDSTAEEDAYAEWEPVTIATGAPEFGEINFSPVDITPINGGMYEVTHIYIFMGYSFKSSKRFYWSLCMD